MNLTPLKYLLFIENVTSVFRNYLCLKKRRTRMVVLLWVVFESFNIAVSAVANYAYESDFHIKASRIYFVSSAVFSIYVMIASLYYSKRFYSLLLNFDAFYNIFDDQIYNQAMTKAQKVLTSMVVSFCGIKIVTFAYMRVSHRADAKGWVITTLTQYSISISDFRYIFQYLILHCILFVVSEQLKAITRSIDCVLSTIRETRRNVEHAENLLSVALKLEKLNKWVKAYENINDSSNLCISMFSVQLTIMLLIGILYYTILLYTIALITVEGVTTFTSLLMNLYFMTVFLMALFVVSRSGQNIQNNYMELRQKLCDLCVQTLENEEYYKLTKDLLRYVRTRPVRVHICGSLDVNMSMLPSLVTFFTSYTIIALQFNNVL